MEQEDWRARLKQELAAQGKSMRGVSLEADLAHGYVNSILNERKDPTVANLQAVCKVLGITLPYLLYGYNFTPALDRLVALAAESPERTRVVLDLLEKPSAR